MSEEHRTTMLNEEIIAHDNVEWLKNSIGQR